MEAIIVAFIRRPQLLRTRESRKTTTPTWLQCIVHSRYVYNCCCFFCVYLLRRNLPQLLQISSLFLWLCRIYCLVVLWFMWPETGERRWIRVSFNPEMSGFNDSKRMRFILATNTTTIVPRVQLSLHTSISFICIARSTYFYSVTFRHIYILVTFVANSAYRLELLEFRMNLHEWWIGVFFFYLSRFSFFSTTSSHSI